ncbi:hypothetical protein Vadar_022701 [Vaccinium darrowii]|uniref:Uncharacterized protein n=1 Tax=Vaccinium darrowii TaxID=229202 RepID=A0ACB7YXV3_9ERIC|nr:hypothetical protein Vadar_022701 [Vaccinium darrowii]
MSQATSTSTSASAGASHPTTMIPGDSTSSSSSNPTQAFHFSSGNPRIEETRGVMHLYRDDFASTSSELPVGRKTLVCVLGVPNHMTYADFCQFCGSFIQHMLEMRIVRNDGVEDKYSVLIRFDDPSSTDAFYKHFNGKHFSSLEMEACHVLFTFDVQYTGSIEHAQSTPASSTEQPSCPVCLERLDQDTSGVLTTICNHSFHCSCISKWTDSSCPVCRYCQQQPEKSICFVCQTAENLWICVICGFVGCGRYKEGHAITHWKDTQHCYSLELDTQRVWDYAGDNYVHRLIQSKTDGKLVEFNQCAHVDDGCGSCNCSVDPGFSEALLNSQVETIVNEYSDLLTSQLENQKIYFETLIREVEEETEREISEAIEKAVGSNQKLQKLQAKLDRCVKEKGFLDELNENLLKNQEIWKAKMSEIEAREKKALRVKDNKIRELEEQLRELMMCLETGNTIEELPKLDETKDSSVLSVLEESA